MKRKKLKLDELKVQSFVTQLEDKEKQTVLGGKRTNLAACVMTPPDKEPRCTCGSPLSTCPAILTCDC